MDIKNLQKITDELNFAVEKLEDFEGLHELPELLTDLQNQSKNLKRLRLVSISIIFLFAGVLGASIGYFASYKYTNNNLKKSSIPGLVVANFENKTDVYLPLNNLENATKNNNYYIFSYKK